MLGYNIENSGILIQGGRRGNYCLKLKQRKVKNYELVKNYYIRWTRALSIITRLNQSSASLGGGSTDFKKVWRSMSAGWPTKKILGFITLETTSFYQNFSISIFKVSPILYTIKACQWNLINFWKLANALIRKKKKHLCSSQWEKKKREKLDFVL